MTEKTHFSYDSADGYTRIHGIVWKPDGEVKAILQICHGMQEFIDRYDKFARFLCGHGILVTGNDHLGHGESVHETSKLGYFTEGNGNACLLADIHRLRRKTAADYPGVPYFMLGHSMGSFLVRQYIGWRGEGLAGAIVMGTGGQPLPLLLCARALSRIQAAFKGWDAESPLITQMSFGAYNKKIDPLRTDKDWLSKDEDIVDAYIANPLNMFPFTLNGYYNMFKSITLAQSKQTVRRIPKTLPVMLVSGAEDPVGNYGKAVTALYETYCKAGIADVTLRLFETDRHEVLNETDREKVYEELLEWMTARMK